MTSRERKSAFLLTTGKALSVTPKAPEQTNSKSKLVAEYISTYQRITQGGLFIDGFSGPQSAAIFAEDESKKRDADLQLNRLHDAITGGDFQVASRKADLTRLHRIEVECYEFMFKIRMLRRDLNC